MQNTLVIKLLVVCVGNICRSPMAAALFEKTSDAEVKFEVRSSGIAALVGNSADPHSVTLCRELGLDIDSHVSRQISDEDVAWADVIFVMDTEQQFYIEKNYPEAADKTFRLGELDDVEIEDPYTEEIEAFRTALEAIRRGVKGWRRKIMNG
ncbi:low molecular weight protein-tyrosine-phosphatase [Allohahella marinimesophila]|uniref:protein-tyrosine-phosphatase n=1 Tax=Allohahella marinimesophila TaxID=1054972 RepID=A0ABP7PBJ4_9GAMM